MAKQRKNNSPTKKNRSANLKSKSAIRKRARLSRGTNNQTTMEEIWRKTCEKHSVKPEIAKIWWNKIDNKYSEPHRFYHNQNLMLAQKAEVLNSDVSSAIVFATIFQYFEFDVKINSVEANCLAFQQFLTDANVQDETLRNSVLKLLGDESVENAEISDDIFEYFQDMDLAVLGAPPDLYTQYVKLLQDEHVSLGLPAYRNMRLKILQTFLTIPHIYLTQSFRDRFEATARENIKKEIEELKRN